MPSHDHDDVAREADLYSPSRSIARGRHRAPQLTADPDVPAAGGRSTGWTSGWTATRTTLAAVTTGTIAVSGALAGCAPATHSAAPDTSSINPATSPLQVAASTENLAVNSALAPVNAAGNQLATLAASVPPVTHATGLLIGSGSQVAKPLAPAAMKIVLLDRHTGKGVPDAHLRIMRKINNTKWATTRIVVTDANGFADYTAKVLTTTKLTVVFDGTTAFGASHGNINTVSMYVPPKPKPKPVVTALTVITPTTTTASSGAGLQVTPPASTTTTTTTAAPSGFGAKAVWLASQQAGKPYSWGGNGPYAFDCSGLTSYVFRQLGVSLPRTAEAQYEATTHVGQGDKQVGDLIFFGGPGSIYHVGIYAGNNQIWHAPSSGQVVSLTTIWDSSYSVGRP